jgi:hypothetical protein
MGEETRAFSRRQWGDIKTPDDMVSPQDKALIEGLEARVKTGEIQKCPLLRIAARSFCYCGGDMPADATFKPEPGNILVRCKQDAASLQLYCYGGHSTCLFWTSKQYPATIPNKQTRVFRRP